MAKRVYANLLGEWVDITEKGTIYDHQDPAVWAKESILDLEEWSYVNVQYEGANYRVHPSCIQVVDG